MLATRPPTYDRIIRKAGPYPTGLLPAGGSGLALFSAAFYGQHDVVHMAEADMVVTCVDTDKDKLFQMSLIYPKPMIFGVEDAWEFAERAVAEEHRWDVVSVDPFTGDAEDKTWETRDLWLELANNVVTLGVTPGRDLYEPDGWTSHILLRSERVSWMVLTRD